MNNFSKVLLLSAYAMAHLSAFGAESGMTLRVLPGMATNPEHAADEYDKLKRELARGTFDSRGGGILRGADTFTKAILSVGN